MKNDSKSNPNHVAGKIQSIWIQLYLFSPQLIASVPTYCDYLWHFNRKIGGSLSGIAYLLTIVVQIHQNKHTDFPVTLKVRSPNYQTKISGI